MAKSSSRPWGLARVHGRSMLPTLRAGDVLLVRHRMPPNQGDLVVVRLPDATIAIKRASFRRADGWWVTRDNPREGVDSALVGEIPYDDVLAVAVARLWPRPTRLRRATAPADPV